MVIDSLFQQNDIIGAGLQAAVVRNDVMSNNIANADVPGFKKKTVKFENYLSDAVSKADPAGKVDLSKVMPTVHLSNDTYSFRMDGNNVDLQSEMVDLYNNSVRYDVMISSVLNNYKRINLISNMR